MLPAHAGLIPPRVVDMQRGPRAPAHASNSMALGSNPAGVSPGPAFIGQCRPVLMHEAGRLWPGGGLNPSPVARRASAVGQVCGVELRFLT